MENLTAKTEPFLDDFEDGNYTGWSSGGGWSATTKVLKESYSTATRITRNNSQNDVDLRFKYMTTDTTAGLFGEMCFRTSSTNALTNNTVLRMATDGMKLQKVVAGVVTVLDSETSATATANTWYRVRILAKGSNVTVWHGEGDDGPMEEVLSSSAVPTLTTVSMWFLSGANAAFAYDDIQIVADGWTSDTAFATNSGNELTSSTFGGVTTTYGYDAWGHMTSKARSSYSASYAWHYGGKLTSVTSDFPSEGTVTYAYGADGRRRERTQGASTLSYRWANGVQAQSDQVGSDTATRRTHIGNLGHFDTATASDSTYRYYGLDYLGSTRAVWKHDRDWAAGYEYGPYGTALAAFGPGTTHRYTGHDWDTALGGYYAPYRYYSPGSGRWLSRDPLGMVDGPNLYGYVGLNPVVQMDPTGGQAVLGVPIVEAFVVAAAAAVLALWWSLTHPLVSPPPISWPSSNDDEVVPTPPTTTPTECPAPTTAPSSPGWPGDDPTQGPPGTEWRGKPWSVPGDREGNHFNPETGESFHPDLSLEPPYGPHWDYRAPDGTWYRVFPDGTMEPK